MKKMIIFITLFILSIPVALANNISLNVDAPHKVCKGDNFTIDVDVNLKNTSIAGFECTVKMPIGEYNRVKIINITGNDEIKKESGKFYRIDMKNSSVFISFATFEKPLTSDFHLMTIKAVALKEGNVSFMFKPIASDENGKRILIATKSVNFTVINNANKSGESFNEHSSSSIIDVIINFLKSILGG